MSYSFDKSRAYDSSYVKKWLQDHVQGKSYVSDSWIHNMISTSSVYDGFQTVEVSDDTSYDSRTMVFALAPRGSSKNSYKAGSVIPDAICYFKITGHHDSYYGDTHWQDDIKIVYPKMITDVEFNTWKS